MIYTDCHMHSDFSGDSNTPMEHMIEESIRRGLKTICFTEHQDPDFPAEDIDFLVDTEAYSRRLLELKDKYQDQIEILYGIEFGLQTHLVKVFNDYISRYPFDFIIGSTHIAYGKDPYYPRNLAGRDDRQIYRDYFEAILENLKCFNSFQVYGHLDFIVRYGNARDKSYQVTEYLDVIDEILHTAIDKGIGLELNTSALKYGLGFAHPHPVILKRYKELGGEILTIGSDAHLPEHIAYAYEKAAQILKSCGFDYYTIFRERKPSFLPIT